MSEKIGLIIMFSGIVMMILTFLGIVEFSEMRFFIGLGLAIWGSLTYQISAAAIK